MREVLQELHGRIRALRADLAHARDELAVSRREEERLRARAERTLLAHRACLALASANSLRAVHPALGDLLEALFGSRDGLLVTAAGLTRAQVGRGIADPDWDVVRRVVESARPEDHGTTACVPVRQGDAVAGVLLAAVAPDAEGTRPDGLEVLCLAGCATGHALARLGRG